jgi:hypothetical protein
VAGKAFEGFLPGLHLLGGSQWRTKKVRIRTIFSLQNDFFFDINISLFKAG